MHRLLQRQIKRFLKESSPQSDEFAKFFDAVSEAYSRSDSDFRIIERSLMLMSNELNEANFGLRNELAEHKQTERALLNEKEELRILIKKLEDAQNQLMQSEKMASIGQLAAGVAHEINNPIGYVYSNLGTLEKYLQDIFGLLDLYEQAEFSITNSDIRTEINSAKDRIDIVFLKDDLPSLMNQSKDGITRVKNIVQNLKDFSHVETSEQWHYSNLHLGLDSTLNIVYNEIKYKANVIKKYENIPEVECLSSQLNQVFLNLLVNASHAIETQGTITISTGQKNDEVCVEISDTGKGIAPEHIQKIFEPFFTTKPVGKGTGLGLSLSYSIIAKHNGRIEVSSQLGKGACFKVWLPIKHAQEHLQLTQTSTKA